MKITLRQKEVLENLSAVTTDGSRFEPQFRLGDRNVTTQVRSLLNGGVVELRGLSLVRIEPRPALSASGSATAVDAMRKFLSGPDS